MLKALMHHRRKWSKDERSTAILAAVIVGLFLLIAVLIKSGLGRV